MFIFELNLHLLTYTLNIHVHIKSESLDLVRLSLTTICVRSIEKHMEDYIEMVGIVQPHKKENVETYQVFAACNIATTWRIPNIQ